MFRQSGCISDTLAKAAPAASEHFERTDWVSCTGWCSRPAEAMLVAGYTEAEMAAGNRETELEQACYTEAEFASS